jgi:predicted NAD/FAD-dependent oxidoreductase
VIREVAGLASQVLGEDLSAPDWTDIQTWRYSQPDVMLDPAEVNGVVPGLWFAGDYLRGGRVHLAAEVGVEVGAAIAALGR